MLYIIPHLEAPKKVSTSLIYFKNKVFYSMNTESPAGKRLFEIKRKYYVLEVDPKSFYKGKPPYRGKIIDRFNNVYHVKANTQEDLLKLVVYQKIGSAFLDFFIDIKNAILLADMPKYIKYSHHIQ